MSNYSDDLDTDDLASFLNNWEDTSSDAGLRVQSRPYTSEKLNPIMDVPMGAPSEPLSEPPPQGPPPGPPPLDLEADFTVGESMRWTLLWSWKLNGRLGRVVWVFFSTFFHWICYMSSCQEGKKKSFPADRRRGSAHLWMLLGLLPSPSNTLYSNFQKLWRCWPSWGISVTDRQVLHRLPHDDDKLTGKPERRWLFTFNAAETFQRRIAILLFVYHYHSLTFCLDLVTRS